MAATHISYLVAVQVLLVLKLASAAFAPNALSYALVADLTTAQAGNPTLIDADGRTYAPSGSFSGVLSRTSIQTNDWKIDWKVSVTGLTTGITAAHIHSGAPGVNGGVIVEFSAFGASGQTSIGPPPKEGSSPVLPSGAANIQIIVQLIANSVTFALSSTYVNVHTSLNMGGEIRGQLTAELTAVGDPHFVGYDGTSFDFHGWNGGVFNLISEADHQLNSRFASYGPNVYNGTWMTAFGARYAQELAVTLEIDIPTQPSKVTLFTDEGTDIDRMRFGEDGELVENFLSLSVNGKDMRSMMFSGQSEQVGNSSLYFPPRAARHANDPLDGPILTITTPDLQFTVYMETEGVVHLDVSVRFMSAKVSSMHGVIGQTLEWITRHNPSIDGSEEDYSVQDGLLGSWFKYNRFGALQERQKERGRSMLQPAQGMVAGSFNRLF